MARLRAGIIALCFWANNFVLIVAHSNAGVTLRLTSIKFGRECGYFFLLIAIETGIGFDGIRIFRSCKRFLSHVSPSVTRLPLLVNNITSAIMVICLFFFCILCCFLNKNFVA